MPVRVVTAGGDPVRIVNEGVSDPVRIVTSGASTPVVVVSGSVTPTPPESSTLGTGLVEYLPMSEASAGIAPVRRVGLHANTGMKFTDATNVPSTTGHVYPLAADFTLVDSDYLWRDDYRLQFAGDFTVAAWVRRTGTDAVYRGIVDNSSFGQGYAMFINASHQLTTNLNDGGAATNLHNDVLLADTWYLVRMWYSAATGLHYNQINLAAPVSEARLTPVMGPFGVYIGLYGGNKPWSGQIGPVMWWNRVLTDAEWAAVYNGGAGWAYDATPTVPWEPTAITGCQLWLAGDDLNGNGDLNTDWADLDDVATWPDVSGGGRDFTQGTAAKKPHSRSIASQRINRIPIINFDGTDDILVRAGNFLTSSTATVFAVLRMTALATFQRLFSSYYEDASGDGLTLWSYCDVADPGPSIEVDPSPTRNWAGGAPALGAATPYIVMWRADGAAWTERVNGVDEVMSVYAGANTGDWGADAPDRDSVTIGALRYGSPIQELQFYKGDLAELIVYDTALSAPNIALVEAYLAGKWGI